MSNQGRQLGFVSARNKQEGKVISKYITAVGGVEAEDKIVSCSGPESKGLKNSYCMLKSVYGACLALLNPKCSVDAIMGYLHPNNEHPAMFMDKNLEQFLCYLVDLEKTM